MHSVRMMGMGQVPHGVVAVIGGENRIGGKVVEGGCLHGIPVTLIIQDQGD